MLRITSVFLSARDAAAGSTGAFRGLVVLGAGLFIAITFDEAILSECGGEEGTRVGLAGGFGAMEAVVPVCGTRRGFGSSTHTSVTASAGRPGGL